MTTYLVVAVKDSALQAFGNPFFVPTASAAVRSFKDEVNRQASDNTLNKHPDDFELWQLAEWDNETGLFIESTERLVRAKDLKQGEQS